MDSNSRVYAARHFSNLAVYSLPSHKDAVVGAFFELNSLDVSMEVLIVKTCI